MYTLRATCGAAISIGCLALVQIPQNAQSQTQSNDEFVVGRGGIPAESARMNEFYRRLEVPLKQARVLIDEGKFSEAAKMSRKALDMDDTSASGWLYLAKSLEGLGEDDQSLTAYRNLRSKAWASSVASDPVTKIRFALALNRTKHWGESVEVFNEAMPEAGSILREIMAKAPFNPNFPDYVRMQGLIHMILGVWRPTYGELTDKEMEMHLKQSIKLLPTNAFAYFYLGKFYQHQEKWDEAYNGFKKAAMYGTGALKKQSEEFVKSHERFQSQQQIKVKKTSPSSSQADSPNPDYAREHNEKYTL